MKLTKIKNSYFRNFEDVLFSEKHVVIYSSARITVLNNALELVDEFKDLDHIYHVCFSPNESKILAISTANIFYIIDINSHSIHKILLSSPFNQNLEGKGCWSFDGDYIFIIATRKGNGLVSQIRKYNVFDFSFEDIPIENCFISAIVPSKSLNKYLILGTDRKLDCNIMGWFDGEKVQTLPLDSRKSLFICGGHISDSLKRIAVFTIHQGTLFFNFEGKEIWPLLKETYDSSSIKAQLSTFVHPQSVYEELVSHIDADGINDAKLFQDNSRIILANNDGVVMISVADSSVVLKKQIANGVYRVYVLSNNIFAFKNYSSTYLYELYE